MKILFCLLLALPAFADDVHPLPPPPPGFGHPNPPPPPGWGHPQPGYGCQVVYPGQNDRNNRHCVNTSAFGVTYNGYFFSDTPCFSDYYSAEQAMRNEPACSQSSYFGSCQLIEPGQNDRRNSHCTTTSYWGVAYQGYFASSTPCFASVGEAMRSMQNSYSCQAPSRYGRCDLIYPGQNDRANRHCTTANYWGVAYDGFFLGDAPCHDSVDSAIQEMQNNPACR